MKCQDLPEAATGCSQFPITASPPISPMVCNGSEDSWSPAQREDIYTGKSSAASPSKYLYSDFVKSLATSTASLHDRPLLKSMYGKKKPVSPPPPGNVINQI